MFGNGAMFGMNGDNYSPVFITAYNRTGETVYKGKVAMADILGTQAETSGTAPHTGNPNGAFNNLGPITQAADTDGTPCYVCADDSIADNALGRWVKCGECEIAAMDQDVGTSDVIKGARISVLVSEAHTNQSTGAQEALTVGGAHMTIWVTGGTRTLGKWLEDGAASSATAARTIDINSHLRWGIWTGGVAVFGSTDT